MPPVIHDHCSAAHPFGVGSAFWKLIDLERYGLTWKWPEIDCAPTVSKSTGELEAYNLNYIGGANNRLRVLFRPRMAIDPYFTGVPGVYLCSQSTPPGAGIHGLCGYHAAQSALRRIRKRPV